MVSLEQANHSAPSSGSKAQLQSGDNEIFRVETGDFKTEAGFNKFCHVS